MIGRDAVSPDAGTLLALYDAQLRTSAEMVGADSVQRLGPLWLGVFAGGCGFVSYRDLADVAPGDLPALVGTVLDHFRAVDGVTEVEWKTRSHDQTSGLRDALTACGFDEGEEESVMIGPAEALAVDVELPPGVTVRRAQGGDCLRGVARALDRAFGDSSGSEGREDLARRLARADPLLEVWMAEVGGEVVGAGRLELVPDSDFAGIWGGGMVPQWRGRGIYRAITAARARSALAAGRRWIHSDSTAMSRTVLERSGLVRVTGTTPWTWSRGPNGLRAGR